MNTSDRIQLALLLVAALGLIAQTLLTFLIIRYTREDSRPYENATVVLGHDTIAESAWVMSAGSGPAFSVVITAVPLSGPHRVLKRLPVLDPGQSETVQLSGFSGSLRVNWADVRGRQHERELVLM